jgi:SAM-dependent methyltransferase
MLRTLLIACLALAANATSAQEEVPFVTTPDNVTLAMLELAGVGPTDHVIDLGSGDGRIVITAARRFGATGQGIEIVGDLVRRSRQSARSAGVENRVEFLEQDLFATDLVRASVVTMYLLPAVNLQLRPRLLDLAPGTRIVSHDWDMGDWTPDGSRRVDAPDKRIGLERSSTLHLWIVPANVEGSWCAGDARLDITQRFQTFSATLSRRDTPAPLMVFDGRIEGTQLRAHGVHSARLRAIDSERLQVESSGLPGQPLAQTSFTRARGDGC